MLLIVSSPCMKNEEVTAVKNLLSKPKKIVIVPHKNPDGDAIGSCLGLAHVLEQLNHNVNIIAPNDYPDFLKWMSGNDTIIIYDSHKEKSEALINDAEIIFTLDFNHLSRTGDMEQPLSKSSALKILIDHHQQPDSYANYIYSDVSMSSTAEMVYHFLNKTELTKYINADVAACLYVGIMTDTGSFRFPNTTSTTHHIIADLIDRGAKNSDIHNLVYDTNSYHRTQLLGRALSNLKVIEDLNTAYIVLSQKDLNEFHYQRGDTEGFVNYGLSVKGVVFATIFIESEQENIIKMSFRSRGEFCVNTFARNHFEGGGHINAAGGKSDLSLNETVEKFISILPNYKTELTQ